MHAPWLQTGSVGELSQDEERSGPGQRAPTRVQEEVGTVAPVEVRAAERDEVSLNAYINYMLATALQQPSPYVGPASPVWDASEPVDRDAALSTARLQRFLAIALAANVAVAAIVATVAVILLLTAA